MIIYRLKNSRGEINFFFWIISIIEGFIHSKINSKKINLIVRVQNHFETFDKI